MKLCIVVNGKPRAGKDTTVDFLAGELTKRGYVTTAISSIDPVRELLRDAGVDTSRKTPQDRDLLAEVGAALEKHSQWRTRRCADQVRGFCTRYRPAAMFVHMREPELINRLKEMLAPDVRLVTVFLERPSAEHVVSNASDAGVYGMEYDVTILNDGSLRDLSSRCSDAASQLLETA